VEPLPYPPELLTIADLRLRGHTATTFVYPDPPLNRLELERLRVLDDKIRVTTPLFLLATAGQSAATADAGPPSAVAGAEAAPAPTASTGPTPDLQRWMIGLSIGSSPQELRRRSVRSDFRQRIHRPMEKSH
jgi:hypothetical protein